jgi:hypothetical protein
VLPVLRHLHFAFHIFLEQAGVYEENKEKEAAKQLPQGERSSKQ